MTAAKNIRPDPFYPSSATRQFVNLLNSVDGVVTASDWPPEHQGRRGTCNAFAVVTAEELYRWQDNNDEAHEVFSKEHFYAAIRGQQIDETLITVDEGLLDDLNKNGRTFLAQAHDALMCSGLAEHTYMPYRTDVGVGHVEPIPELVAQNARARRVAPTGLVHDIIRVSPGENDTPPHPVEWTYLSPDDRVSDRFYAALTRQIPIVASFAILWRTSWNGTIPTFFGEISYDVEADERFRGDSAGHTVCITGYTPPCEGDEDSGGWFTFRNSWGDQFAKYSARDETIPIAPAPGYGCISAAAVDVYCWEFLHRAFDAA